MKHIVAIRGLKSIMDDESAKSWAAKHGYEIRIFDHWNYDLIVDYIQDLEYSELILLGFSKGAETAYNVAFNLRWIQFSLLLTIGTYHTVTSSFGTPRRPTLPNVDRHLNMIEDFQQPAGFFKNPINIDLGPVTHWNSVKTALAKLDELNA